ncbi:hypothetical protein AB0D78_31345 [Streptomyces avermitilis]|uniref:hypothetical protein n=1 Tax=Streptomyces avermitilis TaxID=33903 RepID=UPI0033DF57BF
MAYPRTGSAGRGAAGSMPPMCPPKIHVADVAADGDARTVFVLVPVTDAPFT